MICYKSMLFQTDQRWSSGQLTEPAQLLVHLPALLGFPSTAHQAWV
jgi:hypothetical protein